MLTDEQRKRRREADKRWRIAHPAEAREKNAKYRNANRDVLNARQRADYHARKAAGTLPPSRYARGYKRPAGSITGTMAVADLGDNIEARGVPAIAGTMAVAEQPDHIETVSMSRDELEAAYLRKLAQADMAAWRAHYRMIERGHYAADDDDDDDAESVAPTPRGADIFQERKAEAVKRPLRPVQFHSGPAMGKFMHTTYEKRARWS
jgi:hypothetical protein